MMMFKDLKNQFNDYTVERCNKSVYLEVNRAIKCVNLRKNYNYTVGAGCHKYFKDLLSWDKAQKACQQDGTDLAIVNTKKEEEVT